MQLHPKLIRHCLFLLLPEIIYLFSEALLLLNPLPEELKKVERLLIWV